MQFSQLTYIIDSEVEVLTKETLEMKILAPTNCPSCGYVLERVNDQLFCRNSANCSAQTNKKLQNFCSKLKIKGFGEATLNTLSFSTLTDLLDYTAELGVELGLSPKVASNLEESLNSVLERGISPNDFIAACSIPLIGDGAMRKVKITRIRDINETSCSSLGEAATKNLLDWVNTQWVDMESHWEQFLVTAPIKEEVVSKGITVCITGKLDDFKNRADAAEFLTNKGYEVKSSVTKQVQVLICEDGTQGSSYKKALSNNIKITTIKKLLEE